MIDDFYMSDIEFKKMIKTQKTVVDRTLVEPYIHDGFDMNTALRRKGNSNASTSKDNVISAFLKQFNSFTPNQAFYLYRGIAKLETNNFIKKGELVDFGFCSTTRSFNVAKLFVKIENKEDTCCAVHIHCPADVAINFIPIFTHCTDKLCEEEVVLEPKTILKKICINSDLAKQIIHTMKYTKKGSNILKDGISIILMQIKYTPENITNKKIIKKKNKPIINDPLPIAGSLIHILGRRRKIIQKNQTFYVRFMHEIITLEKAKQLNTNMKKSRV